MPKRRLLDWPVSPDRWRAVRSLVSAFGLAVLSVALLSSPAFAKVLLKNGSVSPRTGTTATLFTFKVNATGGPTSVRAHLTGPGDLTVTLKPPASGNTWSASSRISAPGTWTVTFFVTNDPAKTSGGTVTVTAAPTPTPRPSPTPVGTPVPVATPRPTASTKPGATPVAQASNASGSPTATPSGSAEATAVAIIGATEPTPTENVVAAAGGRNESPAGSSLWVVMLLGLFAILGVGGIALLAGRRSAEEEPTQVELATEAVGAPGQSPLDADAAGYDERTTATAVPAAVEPSAFAARVNERADAGSRAGAGTGSRPRAWDGYHALDDKPIGTVDRILIDGQPRPWDADAPRPEPPADEDED